MTVDVERVYDVTATVEEAWSLLSDPAMRAKGLTMVESYEQVGAETIWHLRLPIPGLRKTASVRTRDVERSPPTYVKFTGDAKIMHVQGEHELTETDTGCRIRNRFVVDGRLPGVESFFKRGIDREIERMLQGLGENVTVRRVR